MKFQAANGINVPFFVSFSGDNSIGSIEDTDYIRSLYNQFYGYGNGEFEIEPPSGGIGNYEMAVLTGFQIKLNQSFYLLPALFCFETSATKITHIRDIIYKGETVKEPLHIATGYLGWFLGSGLFINTDKIKGSVYMGWGYDTKGYIVNSPSLYSFLKESGINVTVDAGDEVSYGTKGNSFKIALVPLVNTSEWKYIGKVLDYILGYFGLGDALMKADETNDSKAAAAASAINAALDFTFNRIHWGNFSLDIQAIYTRGNFDSAAKADTYGAKVTGLFSNFPFGFTFEGGYKNFVFFASPSQYFAQGYNNGTGYFNGSVYFPFKHITLGLLYQYDNIYQHQFGIALSSNTFSGFGTLSKLQSNFALPSWGLRFRWGGWKAEKE